MLKPVDDLCAGRLDLAQLVSDLRGLLYIEADPHDPVVREDFESMWSPIDNEYELRTAPWAPPGLASDENLEAALDDSAVGCSASWMATPLGSTAEQRTSVQPRRGLPLVVRRP